MIGIKQQIKFGNLYKEYRKETVVKPVTKLQLITMYYYQ